LDSELFRHALVGVGDYILPNMFGFSNILIVDSDALSAAGVAAILKMNGCGQVDILPDVDSVFAKNGALSPGLVLFALDSPRMPSLLVASREMQRRLQVPVIFLADGIVGPELEKTGEAAPSSYVMMPVQARELLVVVDAAHRLLTLETRMRRLESKMQEAQRLESVGVMAGGIAHDFNNVITGIFGAVAIAQQELSADSVILQRLDHIDRLAKRAADLCQRLVVQAGKGSGEHTALAINAVVEDALKLAKSGLRSDVVLQTGLANSLPQLRGNELYLRQVVSNLVVNAIEAIGDGAGTIRVVTFLKTLDAAGLATLQFADNAKPGEFVAVEVADTGCGMDEQTMTRIFDPLFTTKASSRGLGLAAVARIVRKHRGGIWVESRPKRGALFRILLPVIRELSLTSDMAAAISGGTIMVVDDDEAVRALAKWVIERSGYHAVTARDGDEALRLFRDDPGQFRLVLLDLTMPRMSGLKVMEGMRKIRLGVSVIIISGHGEDTLSAEEQEGVLGFLQKPFGPDQLRAILNQHVPINRVKV
jgi:signal transduction histidine kinase/ActR/RegA family two-component response regulator